MYIAHYSGTMNRLGYLMGIEPGLPTEQITGVENSGCL